MRQVMKAPLFYFSETYAFHMNVKRSAWQVVCHSDMSILSSIRMIAA